MPTSPYRRDYMSLLPGPITGDERPLRSDRQQFGSCELFMAEVSFVKCASGEAVVGYTTVAREVADIQYPKSARSMEVRFELPLCWEMY